MSTKIYNGFRFTDPDLSRIHGRIMEWRAELRPLHQQAANRFVAEIATTIIDNEALHPGSHAGEMPLMKGISMMWDRQAEVKKSQRRDPAVDFEFSLSLLPFDGQVYGIVFTEQREWQDIWMAKPFIEEYAYWDNTDPPEELPEAEWERRADIWNAILGPAVLTAPSMAGFTADCTHETLMPDSDNVASAAPTLAERVSRRAKIKVVGAEMERLQAQYPEKDSKRRRMFAVEGMNWFGSEAGQQAFEEEKLRLGAILPPRITKKMLLAEF